MSKITHVRGAAVAGGPHLFIATPTYTGKLDAAYIFSLLYSMPRLQAAGIAMDHYVMSHNCHVDDSRNGILRDFLLTECTDLVFIDADVSWEPEALVRLALHDRDIVAGVYPKRSVVDDNFPVHVGPGTTLQADADGLVEVIGAPTGFMKIKRHVIEKFFEANKHRRFTGMSAGPSDAPYTLVFERTYTDGHRWSGDYNFCREWRKMGGKIYVDPEMNLSHLGEVEFSGTLGDHWRKKHGIEEARIEAKFEQAIAALRRGNPGAADFMALTQKWNNPFSAQVELLSTCYAVAKEASGPILEAGSGLSTLVMALANPNVTIHSLEHDPIWASALKNACSKYGVGNVEIHFAPLKQYEAGAWYDASTLPGEPFSLVLCDGPPRDKSNRAVMFQVLGHQMRDSIVLMDDADDDAAVVPINDWSSNLGRSVRVFGMGRKFAISYKEKSA